MSNGRAGADASAGAPKKTAAKTATSPLSGGVIPLGAHPGNTGGKKGRSGRKPLAWKALCRDILSDPATQETLRSAATAPAMPGYASLIRMLAEHGEGVPEQTHIIKDGQEARERIARRIAGIAERSGAAGDSGDPEPG